MNDVISFTPAKTLALLKHYHRAIEAGHDQFTFESKPMLVAYAKYLIEYLEHQGMATPAMNAERQRHSRHMGAGR